jgi:GNAT superfamily N-acetyltransferase
VASELRSEIRACGPGELGRFLQTCFSAFGGTVDDASVARVEPVFELDRLLLAIENGEPAGSAGTIGLRLSVPGGEVPCSAVTMVGVLPGHRRKGIFRRLMERVLEDTRARAEPVSVLWSTEGDLYGRFGYGLAALAARIDLERAHAEMRRERTASASVRLVDADEASAAFPPVYEAVRAGTAGMASRSHAWWQSWRLAGPPGAPASPAIFRALLEVDGRVEAYALYRVHGSWSLGSSTATLEVLEAMGSTPHGTQEIWRFLLSLERPSGSTQCFASALPRGVRRSSDANRAG